MPLLPDEAYYWVWSLFPQGGYYDHPPMVSWLLRLGSTELLTREAVRWPAVIFSHLTYVTWFFIFKELGFSNRYKTWLWLAALSPFLGIFSFIVTPDLPLLVFWSLSTYFFIRLLKSEKWADAFFLGASLGLGFLSKYMMAIWVPLALIYLVHSKIWKKKFWSYLGFTALIAILFSSPVFYWNYKNDFISFKFQLGHGLHSEEWEWIWPVSYFLGQIFLMLPFFSKKILQLPGNQNLLLKYFSLGPLIFFLLTSLKAHVEPNWPIMAYPSFFALVALGNWKNWLFKAYSSFWVMVYIFVFTCMLSGRLDLLHEKLQEPFVYKKMAQELSSELKPFYTINYQIASSIWFNTGKPVYKLYESSRFDFFDAFAEAKPKTNHFFVLKQTHHDWPSWMDQKVWNFKEVQTLPLRHVVVEVTGP